MHLQIMDVMRKSTIISAKKNDPVIDFVPEMLVDEAGDLLRDLGIPQHLADVGVTEDKIELMAADAMKSGNIMANPRQSTIRDIIELYKKMQCRSFRGYESAEAG